MPYFLLSIALVGVDQLVKWWVRGSIPLGTSISFIPHLMDLTYTQNTGAAFSSFSGMTWLLTLVSLGASVVVALLLAKVIFRGPGERSPSPLSWPGRWATSLTGPFWALLPICLKPPL